ncbi:sperm motility kinase X-like [Callospermophilus lateralis]|uniref:sperm motility kinase X-like n=1 Tax=Callospermophilus lateralis TaxID=76772 RepID=UPI0040548873
MHSQNIQRPSSCKKKVVKDHYEFLGVIGQNGFSQIKLACHHLTGAEVAVKVVCKNEKNIQVLSEPNIMRSLDHPNIIQLFQIIETQRNIYIIMEYADGGQLFDHIPPGGMQEEKACRFFKQVVGALDYCHDKGIVHQDLKPENVMADARGNIKLIDFGLSTWFTSGQNLSHFWGTLSHLHFTEALTKHPDPEIMTILCVLGYDPYKTWVSLATRKFNTAMATYLILKHQKSQGPGCMFQGKPVSPRVKSHQCPMDLSHFTGITKRSLSKPVLPTFPMPQLPEEVK